MDTKISKAKAKRVMKETTTKTVKFTKYLILTVFLIIIAYTVIVMIFGFFKSGADFLENVATLSVGGFWAFFLGYFGWRLGQTIEEYLSQMRKK